MRVDAVVVHDIHNVVIDFLFLFFLNEILIKR